MTQYILAITILGSVVFSQTQETDEKNLVYFFVRPINVEEGTLLLIRFGPELQSVDRTKLINELKPHKEIRVLKAEGEEVVVYYPKQTVFLRFIPAVFKRRRVADHTVMAVSILHPDLQFERRKWRLKKSP